MLIFTWSITVQSAIENRGPIAHDSVLVSIAKF